MSLAPAIETASVAGPADPSERGRTVLAPGVVRKIAAQAATEIDGISGLRRRFAGRTVGDEQVYSEADIDGQVVAVRLRIAAAFPARLLDLTREVRRHVTTRVETLCDLRVDHVDITVDALRGRGQQGRVR
jgi:uncharacterized alkaline shock family protein YloU